MTSHESEPLLGPASTEESRGPNSRRRMGNPNNETETETKLAADTDRPIISKEKLFVVLCILSTELCERLTYYSVVANLVLFCQSVLEYDDDTASTITLVFAGSVYIIPVFGGYVADAWAGKFNTIFGSGLLYLVGLVLLPISAVDFTAIFGEDEHGHSYDLSRSARRAYCIIGLGFIAVGTGGIKANVGPFGAQQVRESGPKAVQSFFNWFYWFINAGALLAYSGVAYVQQNIGFDYGFLIPLLSMIVALVIFYVVRDRYVLTPGDGSVVGNALGMCRYGASNFGCNAGCFTYSKTSNGGLYPDSYVDGIKSVIKTLPIFLSFIMYWAIYSQMTTTFFLQSERMNIQIGDADMPAAMLNIFNTIIIMILIPIMDRIVYPFFARINRPLSLLQRIGIGLICASLSVFVAGGIEIIRKDNLRSTGGRIQTLGDHEFNASELTMFVQIPMFAFVGASEVFASISGLEFAYAQAPEELQGLMMGLFLMMSGLGNYLSMAILWITDAATTSDPWLPKDINDGHAEYFFFMLGCLMLFDFVIFTGLAIIIYRKKPKESAYVAEYDNKAMDVVLHEDPDLKTKL